MLTPILLTALCLPATQAPQDPGREARHARLIEELEDARQRGHIAGMALAVVQDDEVVLTHGFGMADIEAERPVTPETVFGIGSTTKAFTATLLGMLADDGKLTWDDPVTDHLPYLDLDTGESEEVATLRDLLSHRSGFTRMGPLMMNPAVTRRRMLETAANAEPWGTFREDFHYNNIMFLAAGMAAEAAAGGGASWEELIQTRIFAPLGMDGATPDFTGGQASPLLAKGYLWNEDTESFDTKDMIQIDSIGPAGAINASVLDMAQWLRLQLGRGVVDGERLIAEETLAETWAPQIKIAGNVSYGLGWFLREWNGKTVIEHGGNVDGFAAQIAFVPEANTGYVLLTNVSVTPLQIGSIHLVFDALLGEWAEAVEGDEVVADDASASGDYSAYVGKYVADFGGFRDQRFTVQETDNGIAVDVPGQTLYELREPDEEGKWYFVLTNEIAVSFDRDDSGAVVGLKMYQAGMTFELPREGVEIAPEIPLDQLQEYLGTYRQQEKEANLEVVLKNNRLALDVPGQMVFELHAPDEEEMWAFRVVPGRKVRFNRDDNGAIRSMVVQQGGRNEEFVRIADPTAEVLPTVAEIMELRDPAGRLAAMESGLPRRVRGTVRFVNSGLKGAYSVTLGGMDRFCELMDFGEFGTIRSVVDGTEAWTDEPLHGETPLEGEPLQVMLLGLPAVTEGDWRETFDRVQVVGYEDDKGEDGTRCIVVRLTKGDLPNMTQYLDPETGDLLRSDFMSISDMASIPVTTRYEGYREVDGERVPSRIVITNDMTGRIVIDIEDFERGIAVDPELFARSR